MLYISLLLSTFLAVAQDPAQLPDPSIATEQHLPEEPPQPSPSPESNITESAPIQSEPVAEEATPTAPATPPAIVSTTVENPAPEPAPLNGKELHQHTLTQLCTAAGLGNCSMDIMNPQKVGATEGETPTFLVSDATQKEASVMAFIVHSSHLLTRKESIDILNDHQETFPLGATTFTPSRVIAQKEKRKSSLILQYEWVVEIGTTNKGKLFVLKHPQSDTSYWIFTFARKSKELAKARLVKFLYSELDIAK